MGTCRNTFPFSVVALMSIGVVGKPDPASGLRTCSSAGNSTTLLVLYKHRPTGVSTVYPQLRRKLGSRGLQCLGRIPQLTNGRPRITVWGALRAGVRCRIRRYWPPLAGDSGRFLNHWGQPFPHLYNGRAGQSEGLWKDARGLRFFQTIPKALSVRG